MGKGYWTGWAIGLIVALVFATTVNVVFDLEIAARMLVGFLAGVAFSGIGALVGRSFDE